MAYHQGRRAVETNPGGRNMERAMVSVVIKSEGARHGGTGGKNEKLNPKTKQATMSPTKLQEKARRMSNDGYMP